MNADTLISLTDRADALKAEGRMDEALAAYARAVEIAPASAVAEHNLAATHGDLAHHAEAEAGCRRAFAKGLDAPETWLVLARALQGLSRMDEAEAAYREALRRRPAMADTHRDLAQLIWMRSEDIAAATVVLDQAIAESGEPQLIMIKARALEFAGELAAAYASVQSAIRRSDGAVPRVLAASLAARMGDFKAALAHAEAAAALDGGDAKVQSTLAQAHLALGQPERALALITPLRMRFADDQFLIALQATAWRMLDDPRRQPLLDYVRLVKSWRLATPPGWSSLDAYLDDLRQALTEHHAYRTHPFGQSVRHGSQMPDLLSLSKPAIRAFPQAVRAAIDAHVAGLSELTSDHPLAIRNRGKWNFHGVWSVRLRPMGFHANHVHPDGWLSSACYIDLPPAIEQGEHEGWIKFGEPGIPTSPPLAAEHYVKPERGMLVLFPSYMWHGTVPFTGEATRLSIAFDLIPAAGA